MAMKLLTCLIVVAGLTCCTASPPEEDADSQSREPFAASKAATTFAADREAAPRPAEVPADAATPPGDEAAAPGVEGVPGMSIPPTSPPSEIEKPAGDDGVEPPISQPAGPPGADPHTELPAGDGAELSEGSAAASDAGSPPIVTIQPPPTEEGRVADEPPVAAQGGDSPPSAKSQEPITEADPLPDATIEIPPGGSPDQAADTPAATADPTDEPPGDDPVIRLLTELEGGAADLRAFTADIVYEVEDALLGEKVVRKGELIYRARPETKQKSFAILFDTVIENRRKREKLKHYIFSGRWLVEVDHDEKLFIKREVVPPGEDFDPLKLGEGPFPLPIGQPKDEVLARFDVTLCPLPDTGILRRLAGAVEVDGLKLIPKADTAAAEDVERIDVFYDRATRLPVGVNLIETNGDRKTARLDNVKRNPALGEVDLAKLSITEPDPTQWHIDIRPLER